MATDKTSASLSNNTPPTYGSQDAENPPLPQDAENPPLPQDAENPPLPQESPPPYVTPPNNIPPPPSYYDIVNKIRRTREESDSYPQFFKNLAKIIAGTFGCITILATSLAIPISMIIIGAIYKDQCPAQPKIPIYLIVMGAFALFLNVKYLLGRLMNCMSDDDSGDAVQCCDGLIWCFLLAWFISGNVWIYSIYKPPFDPTNPKYCNQTLYLYSFWITTSGYIFTGLSCVCCCCIACAVAWYS